MIFKNALKEITRSWSFSLFFTFTLSLGLSGFLIINSYKEGLDREAKSNAKNILSADLAVSARRQLTSEEKEKVNKILPPATLTSEVYEFFAMITTQTGSRLVMVKAIDDLYPLYGSIELKSKFQRTNSNKQDLENQILIAQELQDQMNLKVGDTVQLGKIQLKIQDVVTKDTTQTFRAATLAPRVFMSIKNLASTGLIQYGSTFSHAFLYKISDSSKLDFYLNSISSAIPDPSVNIDTSLTASQDSSRQLQYLFDYLGLASIVALFLSSFGGLYLFRLFLNSKNKQVAIYRSLGFLPKQVFNMYLIQVVLLSVISLAPAYIIAVILNPVFSKLISQVSSFELNVQISLQSFLVTSAIALLGSVLMSLAQLMEVKKLSPSQLFQEKPEASKHKYEYMFIFVFLFFCVLSAIQANSWKVGLSFVAIVCAVLFLLAVIGGLMLKGLLIFKKTNIWFVKYSALSIARNKRAAISVFVSLGLGTLLMGLLPQLKESLKNEFEFKNKAKAPSLFLFDIQDEQIESFLSFLKTKNISPDSVSPLIKSRIISVNGTPFERKVETTKYTTREEERDSRFRNRGVNLSYRNKISESEKIIEGNWSSTPYDFSSGLPFEISIEKQYAQRMNLKMNDQVQFDIQGMELTGVIKSLRKVRWASFQPNFFMLIQPGVLEDAPKTYIVSLPPLSQNKIIELQNEISKNYTNVSTLNVKTVMENVLNIADQMSWSLELMSALALLAGYVVLYSVIKTHLHTQRYEFAMMKVLGAKPSHISLYILCEYLLLTTLSALLGAVLSIGVSYGLSYYVFEGSFVFNINIVGLIFGGVLATTVLVSFFASRKTILQKPIGILSGEL